MKGADFKIDLDKQAGPWVVPFITDSIKKPRPLSIQLDGFVFGYADEDVAGLEGLLKFNS